MNEYIDREVSTVLALNIETVGHSCWVMDVYL